MQAETGVLDGSTKRRRRRSRTADRIIATALVRLGDICVVVTSGLLASQLRFSDADQPSIITAALLIGTPVAANIFSLAKIYRLECLARLSHQLPHLLTGWTISVGAVLTILYAMKLGEELSRLWIGYWLLAGYAGLVLWRLLVKRMIGTAQTRGYLRHNLIIIGNSTLIVDCLARLQSDQRGPVIAGVLVLGDENISLTLPANCVCIPYLTELETAIRDLEVDQVVLAVPLGRAVELLALLDRLKYLPVEVGLYAEIVGIGVPIFGLTRLADAQLLQLMQHRLDDWRPVLKELKDRLLALLLLILTAPVLAIVALAIKLTSPGPILYRQVRRGFNREPIRVIKFRTMHVDLCDPPGTSYIRQAVRDDPRVTPIGYILRRTSLDETPQLINVLRGEMSLVGPRPHAITHDDYYSERIDDYVGRHRVKPGITGWAQVNGCRGETQTLDQMRRRIELDLHYIENWSLLLDIRIILMTVRTILVRKGAY